MIQDIINETLKVGEKEIFKPASKKEIQKRTEDRAATLQARKAEYIKQGKYIPVDKKTHDMDYAAYQLIRQLDRHLDALMREHSNPDHSDDCACDLDVLDDLGEDYEIADIPGTEATVNRRCLRCGGYVELR